MTKTIMIVDDEADLRRLMDFNLRNAGFKTILAENGAEAIKLAQLKPDLIVLDLMLPDVQGTDVCRELKRSDATREIPVLILSARGDEIDRVVGFELGAEDYVVKPFSVRELILRINAILKRSASNQNEEERSSPDMTFGSIRLDQTRHRVWVEDEELTLTALEFKLLATFISRKGRVQTRERLLDDVWGIDGGVTTRTVDTHVKRLREKLGGQARYVETVRGVGYRFAEKPDG